MQRRRGRLIAFWGLALLFGSSTAIAVQPKSSMLDLSHLKLVGNESFPDAQIIRALRGDLEWAAAEARQLSFGDLLPLLERRIARGYANAGFPDARIAASHEPTTQETTLRIEEGQRCLMGEVAVEGAGPIAPERIVECLTQKTPGHEAVRAVFRETNGIATSQWVDKEGSPVKLNAPTWIQDKPLPLSEYVCAAAQRVVKQMLEDIGYRDAKFEVTIARHADSPRATLLVKIADIGQQAIVDQIEVSGLQQNSYQDVLSYLDLHPGMLFTRHEQLRIEQSLWRSARFLHYTVALTDQNATAGSRQLHIELEECEFAPPLWAEFSAKQAALLKLRDWLATFSRRNLDASLEFNAPGQVGRFVLSPRHGAIVWFKSEGRLLEQFSWTPGGWPAGGLESLISQVAVPLPSTSLDQAVIASDEMLGIANLKLGRKFILPPEIFAACVQLNFNPLRRADRRVGQFSHFSMGLGGKAGQDEDGARPPLEIGLQLAPVSFLLEERRANAKVEIEDGVLRYSCDGLTMRSRAESGECLEFGSDFENRPGRWQLTFAPGAFDQQMAQIQRQAADHPNLFDAERWATSLTKYLIADDLVSNLLGIGPPDRRLISLVQKALDNDLLEPLDRISRLNEITKDWFYIPPEFGDPAPSMTQKFAFGVYPLGSLLLPADSWPADLWRLAALLAVGKAKESENELRRFLADSDHGAPSCLAVAGLLHFGKLGNERSCATRAYSRLSTTAFRRDCRALWSTPCGLADILSNLAKTVTMLDDEETELVCQQVPKSWESATREFVLTMREQRERPPLEALEEAAAKVWESQLRKRASDCLWSMISAVPAAKP